MHANHIWNGNTPINLPGSSVATENSEIFSFNVHIEPSGADIYVLLFVFTVVLLLYQYCTAVLVAAFTDKSEKWERSLK